MACTRAPKSLASQKGSVLPPDLAIRPFLRCLRSTLVGTCRASTRSTQKISERNSRRRRLQWPCARAWTTRDSSSSRTNTSASSRARACRWPSNRCAPARRRQCSRRRRWQRARVVAPLACSWRSARRSSKRRWARLAWQETLPCCEPRRWPRRAVGLDNCRRRCAACRKSNCAPTCRRRRTSTRCSSRARLPFSATHQDSPGRRQNKRRRRRRQRRSGEPKRQAS